MHEVKSILQQLRAGSADDSPLESSAVERFEPIPPGLAFVAHRFFEAIGLTIPPLDVLGAKDELMNCEPVVHVIPRQVATHLPERIKEGQHTNFLYVNGMRTRSAQFRRDLQG